MDREEAIRHIVTGLRHSNDMLDGFVAESEKALDWTKSIMAMRTLGITREEIDAHT